jgi:antitoxin Phd
MAKSRRYSIAEARSNLSTIVHCAEAGDEIELTRHGKPVAVVVSLQELERLRSERPRFHDAYRRFLAKHSPAEIGLEKRFYESIRDKRSGRKVAL